MRAIESLKIGTLIGCVCPKHTDIQMKKYRRAMFHMTLKSDAKFEEN